jgi:anthranilate synthase component I
MTHFSAIVVPLQLQSPTQLEFGFSLYRRLLSLYGPEQLLLFESLGRHSKDARSSLIAMDPLLNIHVHGRHVSITGNAALIHAVALSLENFTITNASDTRLGYALDDRRDIWRFLRTFESTFGVEKSDAAAPLALFGYFGYETIHYIETLPSHQKRTDTPPEISLTLYRTLITIDDRGSALTHYRFAGDEGVDVNTICDICESTSITSEPESPSTTDATVSAIRFETSQDAYIAKCERALEHIRIGDIYQVQIGHTVHVETNMAPWILYDRLRRLNPSPYMYLLPAAGSTIVGASPELFMRTDGDRIVMRPIAGTVGKAGGRTQVDAEKELKESEKETAEHLMLVDLCRNDICRVCEPGTLVVEDLMEVEEYSHVFHMVSSIVGDLHPGFDKYDAICAAFPAGTMTGAPKIRAIELIEDIEDSARGQYAGIIGMFGVGSHYLNTALCIRSATHKDGVFVLRASAGVVSDSIPQLEYRETLQKLNAVFKAVTGEDIACAAA